MADPSADAIAAFDAAVVHSAYIVWLDITGDPIRVTTAPYSLTFAATGDADLDGHTFQAMDPSVVTISDITQKEGGGDTVNLSLSGMVGLDSNLLDQLGNVYNWRGRVCRIWRCQLTPDLAITGNVWDYHTGYMTVPEISGDDASQVIQLSVESYLSFITQPSNRTYLNQADYDAGDHSAELAAAIANGTNAANFPTNPGGSPYLAGIGVAFAQ